MNKQTKLEQKYDFALDMIIKLSSILNAPVDTKEELDKNLELLLDNFDVDPNSEILTNKKLRKYQWIK